MVEDRRSDSLEERLKSHARSFDSLMSLIPAKYYYGQDKSDQWQRKKQTKEEACAAKRAKLDPDNVKSAKDVLDEQAANQRKRKREEDGEASDVEGDVELERPMSNTVKKGKQTKKQKREEKGNVGVSQKPEKMGSSKQSGPENDETSINREKAEKKRRKKQEKRVKEEKYAAKAAAKKERKKQETALKEDATIASIQSTSVVEGEDKGPEASVDVDALGMSEAFNEPRDRSPSTASPSPTIQSIDTSNDHSNGSSTSSIVPSMPADNPRTKKAPESKEESHNPKAEAEQQKLRLIRRIDELRAARKADGLNGAPAKNRQELMEARRQKEEQRRAHKKELRRIAKEAEQREKEEMMSRGSPLLSPGSPLTPSSETNNLSFGRINFSDGRHASANLNEILEGKSKMKGPSDPRNALLAAQKKQSRLSALDDSKRNDIAEKERWLQARKRAHGERPRDDTSLLKKTLKRKEKQKKKSEKEWDERIEGVQKGQAMRQKKREANLQKRKDEKGGGKGKFKKGKSKPKARPGFEGSFRAKAPSAAVGNSGPRRR